MQSVFGRDYYRFALIQPESIQPRISLPTSDLQSNFWSLDQLRFREGALNFAAWNPNRFRVNTLNTVCLGPTAWGKTNYSGRDRPDCNIVILGQDDVRIAREQARCVEASGFVTNCNLT
jgi:hypothetical protein